MFLGIGKWSSLIPNQTVLAWSDWGEEWVSDWARMGALHGTAVSGAGAVKLPITMPRGLVIGIASMGAPRDGGGDWW